MSTLPDAIERRNLLYGDDTTTTKLVEMGEAYLDADMLLDALEFFARAEHADGIDAIRKRAVRDGDAFLAQRVAQLDLEPLSADQWRELGRHAESKGLTHYASVARRASGDASPDAENGAEK